MDVAILALEGTFDTGLCAVLDTFVTANMLATRSGDAGPYFSIEIVSVSAEVRSGLGMQITATPLAECNKPDWIIVPALRAQPPDALEQSLARPDINLLAATML